ncbi:MAG: hypothetical protein A3H95_03040 [Acidobacteria bacterium RIFCSPLOWO2_02_FULL_64_15]|nr:MAG: hypothetical protein A3H95_03040 [Acidobacteria bacterium RIFCSPLOWO2_02_FULL_64_15]
MLLLLGVVIGYLVAVTAASNILLPLFWAWPKARRLSQEGKLVREIPAARFLTAPVIWTGLLVLLTGIAFSLSKAGQLGTGAPMVPAFGLADSGFRYGVLCLTMVHVVCAHKMRNANDTLTECLKHLAEIGAKQNATDGFTFFNSPVTIGQAYKSGNEVARQFMNGWSEWIDLTRADSGNARAGTPVVCAMLKRTESESSLTEPDQRRLWPLACWFEGWIPTIDSSFDQLTSVKKR